MKDTDAIKSQVKIEDILERYARLGRRKGRAPCPIHGGENDNFKYDGNGRFYCFTCGAHGDIFDLVGQIFNIGFAQAVETIVCDFGVNAELTPEQKRQNQERKMRMEAERKSFESDCGRVIDLRCELEQRPQTERVKRQLDYLDRVYGRARERCSFGFDVGAMIESVRRFVDGCDS